MGVAGVTWGVTVGVPTGTDGTTVGTTVGTDGTMDGTAPMEDGVTDSTVADSVVTVLDILASAVMEVMDTVDGLMVATAGVDTEVMDLSPVTTDSEVLTLTDQPVLHKNSTIETNVQVTKKYGTHLVTAF